MNYIFNYTAYTLLIISKCVALFANYSLLIDNSFVTFEFAWEKTVTYNRHFFSR